MNERPITKDIKKPNRDWEKGWRCKPNWSHIHMRLWRDISAAEVSPKEPHQAPQTGAPGLGRRGPTKPGCENKQGFCPSVWVRQKSVGNPRVPQEGPAHRLTPRHSTWATADGQELEGYQRETELSGFRERAGEIAMSVPLLSPPPTQQAGRCHLSFVVPFYQMAESKSALTC